MKKIMFWLLMFATVASMAQTSITHYNGNQIGIQCLPNGLHLPEYPADNKTILFGGFPDTSKPLLIGGFWQTFDSLGTLFYAMGWRNYADSGYYKAMIECVRKPDGDLVVELEAGKSALQVYHDAMVFGDYDRGPEQHGYFLEINPGEGEYQIGDYKGKYNATYIQIDDVHELIKLSNVPTYADDAAAQAAGLTSGHLYKSTGFGSTFLKIVP